MASTRENVGTVIEHQKKLFTFVEGRLFQTTVIVVICANALTLGLETLSGIDPQAPIFRTVEHFFVGFFLTELILRVAAHGPRFFRSPWNLVDAALILGTVLASSSLFAAFRAFRILRVLRVVTVIPRMRDVVKALFDAVPGILSVGLVALLIVYVFAVIASTLFGESNPEYFADVFISMYTLFQIMTLEGWREIADAVQVHHDYAWIFFLCFVLVGTFTLLNLFIAIVVKVVEEETDEIDDTIHEETRLVLNKLDTVSERLEAIEARLDRAAPTDPTTSDSASQ